MSTTEGGTGQAPDPYALAELSRDVRPPDYATEFVRMAVQTSGLDKPIAVAAVVRPEWLAAVVLEFGVVELSVPKALALYARRLTRRHVRPMTKPGICGRPRRTRMPSFGGGRSVRWCRPGRRRRGSGRAPRRASPSTVPALAIWAGEPWWITCLNAPASWAICSARSRAPTGSPSPRSHGALARSPSSSSWAAAGVGELVDPLAFALGGHDEALVLEGLQRRVDRAGARRPSPAAALGDLLDHLVAVHRALAEQGQDGQAHVAAGPAAAAEAGSAEPHAARVAAGAAARAAPTGSFRPTSAAAAADRPVVVDLGAVVVMVVVVVGFRVRRRLRRVEVVPLGGSFWAFGPMIWAFGPVVLSTISHDISLTGR